MKASGRAIYLGAALLAGLAGRAEAAEDRAAPAPSPAHDTSKAAPSAGSVGAGGLTGSGATQDGARTGRPDTARPTGSSSPAAGTAR